MEAFSEVICFSFKWNSGHSIYPRNWTF
uniref:Uncharacterized protein n=1 Tax=Anguilla anguilla TaxID=7936 RepID=A0A0E9UN09_ANGAN